MRVEKYPLTNVIAFDAPLPIGVVQVSEVAAIEPVVQTAPPISICCQKLNASSKKKRYKQ